jgi:hypothetical protein
MSETRRLTGSVRTRISSLFHGRTGSSFHERVISFLDYVTVITEVIRLSQISVIVVAGGALILLANDQGREITVHMGRSLAAELIYFISVTFWAAQAWFWARLVLTVTYGTMRGCSPLERAAVNQIPRLLGAAAFLITAIAFSQVGSNGLAALSVLAGAVFYLVVMRRRKLMGVQKAGASADLAGTYAARQDFGVLLPIMAALSIAVIVTGSILALISPVRFGTLLGGGAIAFIALGSIIPAGSALNLFAIKRRFPLVPALLILLALFSLWNDNHFVRQTSDEPLRAEPAAEFERWAQRLPASGADDGHPLIIVTTAGGGLRAAYWTTTVLGAMQDHVPRFSDHLFAISGVSGGSLGATIFTTLLAGRDLITCENGQPPALACFEQAGQNVLSQDFLGPTIMSLLYTDFMQRFLPVAILPDRAAALEDSWALSWSDQTPDAIKGRLAGGFTALWRDAAMRGDWLPALLLNGTLREDGKRVVTSHLRVGSDIFPSTYDFFDLHCAAREDGIRQARDVPVVSAIMNSTRFPYLTPAGTMRNCHQPGINHILDGGYFENFGAVTALDMLNWAVAEAGRKQVPIRPVIIQIVSNPVSPLSREVAPFQFPAQENGNATPALPPAGSTFLSELFSPIDGIFETRSARGVLAAVHLRDRIAQLAADPPSPYIGEPLYVRLELMDVAGADAPSLGWVLSDNSRRLIRNQIVCIGTNRVNLMRLLQVFNAGDSTANGRLAPVDCLTGSAPQG